LKGVLNWKRKLQRKGFEKAFGKYSLKKGKVEPPFWERKGIKIRGKN